MGWYDYLPHKIMGMTQQDAAQPPSKSPFRSNPPGFLGDWIAAKQQAPQAPSLNDAYSRLAQLLMVGGDAGGGPGPGNWFGVPNYIQQQAPQPQQNSDISRLIFRTMM